ncbi:hypothetical protein EDC04DRAFT_2664245, partial [Pisolithus marmoratus]
MCLTKFATIFGGISQVCSYSSFLVLVADTPDVSQVVLTDMAEVVVSRELQYTILPFTRNNGFTRQVFDAVLFEVFCHLITVDGLDALVAIRRGVKAEGIRTIGVLARCSLVLKEPVCSGARLVMGRPNTPRGHVCVSEGTRNVVLRCTGIGRHVF